MSGRLIVPPAACELGGLHWHQLVDQKTGGLMQYGIQHEWIRSTGHPSPADPGRPHRHAWDEPGVRAALRGHLSAADLELAVRALVGQPMTGPSVATRPGGAADWVDNEEAVARTLHPELRPARLRDG